jgi:hypothetical protein
MKGRTKREAGGVNEAKEDEKKTPDRTAPNPVSEEAEEKKHGGRAKRKEGGKVEGEKAKMHAGRKPRKNGGRTGSDTNPFTSARHMTPPKGHSTEASE